MTSSRTLYVSGSQCFVALFAVFVSTGCPPDPALELSNDTIAEVAGVGIERRQFLSELSWAGVARNEDPQAKMVVAQEVLNRMIDTELLLLAAKSENISVDEADIDREVQRIRGGYPPGSFSQVMRGEQLTEESFRQRAQQRLIVEQLLKTKIGKSPIEDSAIEEKFATDRPMKPEEVWVRHILLKTAEEARHLLQQIRAGKYSFESAARKFSHAPEADVGGSLGWLSRGRFPAVFETAFELKRGEISEVTPSDFGFHIFELVDRREAGPATLDDLKAQLGYELKLVKEATGVRKLLEELRGKYPISIDTAAIEQTVSQLETPKESVVDSTQIKVEAP